MPTSTPYVTSISNVKAIPTATGFTVTFDTDVPVLMAMDYWAQNDPSLPAPLAGSILEGVLRTQHSMTTTALPAGDHTGKFFGFSLRLDTNDVSGKTFRSYQGMVQTLGARTVAKANAVPVKFNNYGDGTRPPNGGAVQQTGPLGTYLVGGGNWSSYTWAQYLPSYTTLAFGTANAVLKRGAGYLYNVIVAAAGTTGFTIRDDAGSGTGPILYTSPGAPAAGTVVVNLPFSVGLSIQQLGGAGSPGSVQVS